MIRNKMFGLLAILVLGLLGLPGSAAAQTPPKIPRVGYVFPTTSTESRDYFEAVRQGFRELGYVEGKSIALEVRWAEGRFERFPKLLAEMVRLKVDVLVVGSTPGNQAAKKAVTTIPIVMVGVGDPVRSGLVASLARPGGNLTGVSLNTPEISGKRLQFLKEVVPPGSRASPSSRTRAPRSMPSSGRRRRRRPGSWGRSSRPWKPAVPRTSRGHSGPPRARGPAPSSFSMTVSSMGTERRS